MDLFNYDKITDVSKCCKNFKTVANEKKYKSSRKIINDWANGFIDRDNKFIYEFQTTFNSSFWELYCFAVIKKLNLKCDLSYNAPDFVILDTAAEKSKNYKYIIECTIAEPPADGLREDDSYQKTYPTRTVAECLYRSTIRLSNSISSKSKKFIDSYSKKNEFTNIPYIIAMAPFDQPNPQVSNLQGIMRVLYAEEPCVKNGYGVISEFSKIEKKNGSEIELGYFKNEDYKHISAVLYSHVATIGKAVAMTDDVNVCFIHKRYTDKDSIYPEIGINYRLDQSSPSKINKSFRYKQTMFDYFDEKFDCNNNSSQVRREPFYENGYKEDLTDGLHLFLNPYALNKLSKSDVKEFEDAGICIWEYDVKQQNLMPISDIEGKLQYRKFSYAIFH